MLKTMTVAIALAFGSATAYAHAAPEMDLFGLQSAPEHQRWSGFNEGLRAGPDAPRHTAPAVAARIRHAQWSGSLMQQRRDSQWSTGG